MKRSQSAKGRGDTEIPTTYFDHETAREPLVHGVIRRQKWPTHSEVLNQSHLNLSSYSLCGMDPRQTHSFPLQVTPGFEWREPGCSMCLAMNADVLTPGERCASTSNRNFEGRQGKGGRTHLVSPAMAAAAAVEGHFVDIRSWNV